MTISELIRYLQRLEKETNDSHLSATEASVFVSTYSCGSASEWPLEKRDIEIRDGRIVINAEDN